MITRKKTSCWSFDVVHDLLAGCRSDRCSRPASIAHNVWNVGKLSALTLDAVSSCIILYEEAIFTAPSIVVR